MLKFSNHFRWIESLNGGRIFLGAAFFAASLTPSLVPRSDLIQGALSGGGFAIGYGIGAAVRGLWRYLELPQPAPRARDALNVLALIAALFLAIVALSQATDWQNSTRLAMGMKPADATWRLTLSFVAAVTALALFLLAWIFGLLFRALSSRVARIVPRRLARVIAAIATTILFWSIANNLVVRTTLNLLDSSFAEWDRLFEPERAQPTGSNKTGSAQSLVRWEELGRTGRRFVASAPSAEQISELTGRQALTPVRVYVGLQGAGTARDRAKLALEELKRQGGFDRSNLIIVTPTGTGWIDPAAMDSIEYLHDGDVASVAIQYSYLNSPLSLLVQPELGSEAARALFSEVYGHWTSLRKDKRPKLYLHGLSLGSLNSETSIELFEILRDPINGALWSGPPFANRSWRSFTEGRNEGTPIWLPEFRNGEFVRFMNQNGSPVSKDTPWGPFRIAYLQYASDPITFFDFQTAYRRPAWIAEPRAPDIAPDLQWYPIITMLQLAIDMGLANKAPMGFGHVFAPEHYVDAWVTLTEPQGWSEQTLSRLKTHLAEQARMPAPQSGYEDRGG